MSSSPPRARPMPITGTEPALRFRRRMLALTALAIAAPLRALAQTGQYPQKQVKIVLGYAAGGAADIAARLVAASLRAALGQTFFVENRPGASGNIAAQAVAQAPADGYTIFFGNSAEMAVNASVMKEMGFNPATDFTPIVRGYLTPLALIVTQDSRHRTLGDLIAYARQNPNKLNYASAGAGTPGHLAGESLAARSGTRMTHIPYKGGSNVALDVMSGQVDFYFPALGSVAQLVKAGKLRVLALSSATRSPFMPDIPTVSELMLPGFDFTVWGGLFAPAKTPREIVTLINRTVNDAYRRPDIREQFAGQLSEVVVNSPEDFGSFVSAEIAKYSRIVKEVGYVER